jgi:hypothetical protein
LFTVSGLRDGYPLGWVLFAAGLTLANIAFLVIVTMDAARAYRAQLHETSYATRIVAVFALLLLFNFVGFMIYAQGTLYYSLMRFMPND